MSLPIIIDNGSGFQRAGFADSPCPSQVVVTATARDDTGAVHCGDRAFHMCDNTAGGLHLSFPVFKGVVTKWEDLLDLWRHIISEMNLSAQQKGSLTTSVHKQEQDIYQHGSLSGGTSLQSDLASTSSSQPILVAQDVYSPKHQAEWTLHHLMEGLNAPAGYVCSTTQLAIFSSGKTTGLVTELGEGVTNVVPVVDGSVRAHLGRTLGLSGRDITECLANLLSSQLSNREGFTVGSCAHAQFIRSVKHKFCAMSPDFDADVLNPYPLATTFNLPDGTPLPISLERVQCTEILFRPSLIKRSTPGLHELLAVSTSCAEAEERPELWSNVVMAGGTASLEGLSARLTSEFGSLLPVSAKVKAVMSSEPQNSSWIGGSVLTSLGSFQDSWITREEYMEYGPSVVHRKAL